LRADAADRLAEMRDQIQAILDEVHVDADMFDLPELPQLPEAEFDTANRVDPLLDSRWDFTEQCRRLISSKRYTNGDE
jgi:hypothetical protein